MSVSEKYPDFAETNVIFGWTRNEVGGYVWGKIVLDFFVAGDTDSGMLEFGPIGKEIDIEEAIEVADEIGKATNESFPDFCMHAFNCPESRRDTIKTDREVVSDKSLFLSKKRYIMHVVDEEGKRVDKLKITGVEIKKSDSSKVLREYLLKLVNLILDDRTRDEILGEINNMKRDFMLRPPVEIAKPMSVKTLKKCQDIFDTTGDMKGFPYQVRAAMFWNSMCGVKDKRIMPGDKIGLIYIKNSASKYIGFPIDMTVFPEWFDRIIIDRSTEWKKVQTKIENYLSSLGWDSVGYQKNNAKKLFGM